MISFLREIFRGAPEAEALAWGGRTWTYGWLDKRVDALAAEVVAAAVRPGDVVALEGDFSPDGVAALLALAQHGCILVPLTTAAAVHRTEFLATACCQWSIAALGDKGLRISRLEQSGNHPLLTTLRSRATAGLVLFSSGSTGRAKAAVHDLALLLEKFRVRRSALRSVSFLLYDHIGGINTLFYGLANRGCTVTVPARDPDTVLAAIAQYRVELLPTSPTFLNLMLISEAWRRHDLSSLRLITYGTEPMPSSTLQRLLRALPGVELRQTYGLSELGILQTRSRAPDSLWLRLGGDGFETRVVDGILQIRARSAMLGYLNADSPFTADGWFVTGDEVEVDGEWVRIIGRRSEMINVGGEKVHPAEIEGVLQDLPNVAEASVHGEPHPITGQIVCAVVQQASAEDPRAMATRLKRESRAHLRPWQVPVRITITAQPLHGDRFKKLRSHPEGP